MNACANEVTQLTGNATGQIRDGKRSERLKKKKDKNLTIFLEYM